jgi:hypothetical protein
LGDSLPEGFRYQPDFLSREEDEPFNFTFILFKNAQ